MDSVVVHLHAIEQEDTLRLDRCTVGGGSRSPDGVCKPGRAGGHALLCVRPIQKERQPRR